MPSLTRSKSFYAFYWLDVLYINMYVLTTNSSPYVSLSIVNQRLYTSEAHLAENLD